MRNELINLSEAARILGVTRVTVYSMVDRGELLIERIAGLPYVGRGAVEELRKQREESDGEVSKMSEV